MPSNYDAALVFFRNHCDLPLRDTFHYMTYNVVPLRHNSVALALHLAQNIKLVSQLNRIMGTLTTG